MGGTSISTLIVSTPTDEFRNGAYEGPFIAITHSRLAELMRLIPEPAPRRLTFLTIPCGVKTRKKKYERTLFKLRRLTYS